MSALEHKVTVKDVNLEAEAKVSKRPKADESRRSMGVEFERIEYRQTDV